MSMKWTAVLVVLIIMVITVKAKVSASTHGGVEFIGKHCEVRKAITIGHSRDGGDEWESLKQQEAEAKPVIEALGKWLDAYLVELKSTGSTHPWARGILTAYKGPDKPTGEECLLNLSIVGYDSTYVIFYVREDAWLPVEEMFLSLFKQRIWKQTPEEKAGRIKQGKLHLGDFEKGTSFQAVDYLKPDEEQDFDVVYYDFDRLSVCQYDKAGVEKLRRTTRDKDATKRRDALAVLGCGGYCADPAFFESFLTAREPAIQREAVHALLLLPDKKGNALLKKHFESIAGIFAEDQRKLAEKYLK